MMYRFSLGVPGENLSTLLKQGKTTNKRAFGRSRIHGDGVVAAREKQIQVVTHFDNAAFLKRRKLRQEWKKTFRSYFQTARR